MTDADACFICHKHEQWPDTLRIYEDDLVSVTHTAADYRQPWPAETPIYHGWLFVEPRRHVPGWADLDPDEAAQLGAATRLGAVALKEVGCEHVYVFTYGDGHSHLHVHLIGRWPGAPEQFHTIHTTEWPGAPRSLLPDLDPFTTRLRNAYVRAIG